MEYPTLDLPIIGPKGCTLMVTITGPEDQLALMTEILSNAEEFVDWLKAGQECGGPNVGRMLH